MKTPQRQKKYSYLLLELLIAFFLLSLFLGPLIDSPFSYLRKQKKEITSIYLHLEAEKQLAFIEEKLRNHTISWKQVLESANKEILLEIKPFTIPSHKAQREAHLILSMGSFQIKKRIF